MFKLVALLAVVAAARAAHIDAHAAASIALGQQAAVVLRPEPYDSPPRYSFSYSVADGLTGDNKAQEETREGDVVQGSYSLIEPDGTRRTVNYAADSVNGFNAVVQKDPRLAVNTAVSRSPVISAHANHVGGHLGHVVRPTLVSPPVYGRHSIATAGAVVRQHDHDSVLGSIIGNDHLVRHSAVVSAPSVTSLNVLSTHHHQGHDFMNPHLVNELQLSDGLVGPNVHNQDNYYLNHHLQQQQIQQQLVQQQQQQQQQQFLASNNGNYFLDQQQQQQQQQILAATHGNSIWDHQQQQQQQQHVQGYGIHDGYIQ